MRYKIRDWNLHFEQDRSRQWKNIKWVPIPNKQGAGYRRIMSEKNGLEIFGCWNALLQTASMCSPRGDLSKYSIDDLSRLTLIDIKKIESAIVYLSQVLDWIEVVENIDINVKNLQENVIDTGPDNSILSNSIQSGSSLKRTEKLSYFAEFWKLYPKKVGKGAAEKAWSKITAPAETLENITAALSWQIKNEQWIKQRGQFIPMPATYLNQRRWEDEPLCKTKPVNKIETIPQSEYDALMAEIKADIDLRNKRLMEDS